ncbi:unnamed protein product [Cyprideis torosa]|uniref:peptidylprolyl isomerase n=1 Tax=Cyprideis torosa TaxID=163714 RepID=A0A7R8WSG5_9CRUS|nr:unnamed protein product [Cyprideis torosa]CAG0909413.1 unnamed protein product [Cyprideis torosa]
MKVSKGKAVFVDYVLSEGGDVIESTQGHEPFNYLHGLNSIVPGLEKALEGKAAGDSFSVTIAPEDGYGERLDEMTQEVSKSMFGDHEVTLGQQFQAQTNQGMQVVTVVAVDGDQVTIDGNHPMAGKTLTFELTVKEVRDATEAELEHGHIHGEGGCGHDH